MEVAEVAVDAAVAGNATELLFILIVYQLNNITWSLDITNHLMLFIVDANQHLVLGHSTHSVGHLGINLYSMQNISKSKQGLSKRLIHTLVCHPLFMFNIPSWGSTF